MREWPASARAKKASLPPAVVTTLSRLGTLRRASWCRPTADIEMNFTALAASPDGHFVATGGRGQEVRVWDLDKTPSTSVLAGHGGTVWSGAFSPSGERVVTASGDGNLRLMGYSVWGIDWRISRPTSRQLRRIKPLTATVLSRSASFPMAMATSLCPAAKTDTSSFGVLPAAS